MIGQSFFPLIGLFVILLSYKGTFFFPLISEHFDSKQLCSLELLYVNYLVFLVFTFDLIRILDLGKIWVLFVAIL